MVQLLVNQVSIAIAQSSLLDQARRQGWYEATLNRISRLLHLPLNIADIRQRVLEEAVAALKGIGGRLYLTPDSTGQTAQLHVCGEQPTCSRLEETPLWRQMMQSPQTAATAPVELSLPLWESIGQSAPLLAGINPGEIFNNKTAIGLYTLQELHREPSLQLLGLAFEPTSIRSILVVPLQYQRQCVGCLSIFRPEVETETLWAGRSHPDQRNSRPRDSFEAWREIKKGQAQPWSSGELKLAEALGIHLYMAVMQRRVEDLIRHQASHDALTGLPNRLLFNERLALALVNAHRQGQRLAVIFLDLDRFKTINDTLGHAVGDRLLQVVAQRLQGCLRPGDTLARWGGDEFTLLLTQIDTVTDATQVAQSLLNALSTPFDFDGQEFYVKASIGIAQAPYDGEDAETLLKNADTAMYRVKQQGKNSYQVYTPLMNTKAFEQLVLENNLHKALERNEFVLHYQPQIDLRTGQLVAMETLVRWQHPVLGLISPSQFIPLAEETGLIGAIGEWVLWTACAQYHAWQQAGLPPFRIAVNLSARQFQQQDLVTMIVRILQENHLHPQSLELEITESIAMQDIDLTISILNKLKTMGIVVSMDDFGIGYSSLSSLIDFPFHALKIDQSFIYDSMTNSRKAAIVKAIVGLGHELKLQVVAEGVETAEQVEFLHAVHCDSMQGYFFSPPLPAEAVRSFCRTAVQATTNPSLT